MQAVCVNQGDCTQHIMRRAALTEESASAFVFRWTRIFRYSTPLLLSLQGTVLMDSFYVWTVAVKKSVFSWTVSTAQLGHSVVLPSSLGSVGEVWANAPTGPARLRQFTLPCRHTVFYCWPLSLIDQCGYPYRTPPEKDTSGRGC